MPELPEVETLCRLMRGQLVGHQICAVQAATDPIVFPADSPDGVTSALLGERVRTVGRKGKFFWLHLQDSVTLLGHLGMSGWIRIAKPGETPPRFWKLVLETADSSVVFTDPRRLGGLWLGTSPKDDPRISSLGWDALDELPAVAVLATALKRRSACIKATLLDQSLLAGLGNYLADEVLYQARIAPARPSNSLTKREIRRLLDQIKTVIEVAVEAEADESRFPSTWLFHARWGGKRGASVIGGHAIVRETIGGRTTAWVPSLQK